MYVIYSVAHSSGIGSCLYAFFAHGVSSMHLQVQWCVHVVAEVLLACLLVFGWFPIVGYIAEHVYTATAPYETDYWYL